MSKNAYVLDDHYGDNGSVTAGMILRDISSTRFTELEKKKLVREATTKEVDAGSQRTIDHHGQSAGVGLNRRGVVRGRRPGVGRNIDGGVEGRDRWCRRLRSAASPQE